MLGHLLSLAQQSNSCICLASYDVLLMSYSDLKSRWNHCEVTSHQSLQKHNPQHKEIEEVCFCCMMRLKIHVATKWLLNVIQHTETLYMEKTSHNQHTRCLCYLITGCIKYTWINERFSCNSQQNHVHHKKYPPRKWQSTQNRGNARQHKASFTCKITQNDSKLSFLNNSNF